MGRRACTWTAAETHYAQEQRAAYHVESQDFQFYLPQIRTLRSGGREVRELLFPGYIFIRFVDSWSSLMHTKGIKHLFTRNDRPVPVPVRDIDYFRSREDSAGFVQLDPPLADGISVVVGESGGSYAGTRGVFQGMNAARRCMVLMSLLGRDIVVDFDRRSLATA